MSDSSNKFEFPQNPQRLASSHEPLLEQGGANRFSAAVTPNLTQAEIKRAEYENRPRTETIEPYVGEYDYFIGQSKYYMQRKGKKDKQTVTRQAADNKGADVNLDEEMVVFFSQHTGELKFDESVPARPMLSSGTSYTSQKSHYLKAQMTSMVPQFTATRDKYDLLGIPARDGDYEYMAKAILNALTQMQSKGSPPTLNFPTNVRFFNQIIYFKDLPDELDADVRLPQTSIPILGNTLKELIISNKSWIITDGAKQPFANMVGDALTKADKQEKELTESLRKRMNLTGLVSMRKDVKGKRVPINFENIDPPCELSTLTMREQKHLNETISPYSGMTLWLVVENSDEKMKERVIWHISQLLRIPAVMVELNQSDPCLGPGQLFRTNSLKVEVLCPMRDVLPDSWKAIFNLQSKKRTLHNLILTMANKYFENRDINFKQWNTLTPAIFLQSSDLIGQRLNYFDLEDEDYKQPVTAKIIDRTFRYALISGNRDVVETIVNNHVFQKIVISRRENVVEDLFQKASQEVYLFSRVILAIKGRNFEFGTNYRMVRDFLQKFFETIFGGGFIWETPSENVELAEESTGDPEKEIIHRAYKYYFSDYVFVWALMCLKFDVALLFLEYSGVQKQDFDKGEVYHTNKGIFQIGNALAASKIMTGMSKILKEDTSVSKEEHETMQEHAIKYENIAISLLNAALKHGLYLNEIFDQELPFWNGITLIELAKQARLKNFFSDRSITSFVNNNWKGYDIRSKNKSKENDERSKNNSKEKDVRSKKNSNENDFRTNLDNLLKRIVTPRNTFFFHVTFYTLFLSMVILLICFYWHEQTPVERDAIFYVYIVYVITNYLDEFYQYNNLLRKKIKNRRVAKKENLAKFKNNIRVFKAALIEYLSSIWNLLDIIIVIGFVISVATYFLFRDSQDIFLFVRIYFGLFSTLFYIRYFQYILIFPGIGPLVYTCLFAFKRMLSFLVIIVLVALCFGIAEVALTSNTSSTDLNDESMLTQRFLVFLFYPIFQIFGHYFLEEFDSRNFKLITLSNETQISVFGSIPAGNFWLTTQFLTFIAIIIWILIANVLLINLMIAYFSQIYEDVSNNAVSIYLLNFIEIVEEYKDKPFFPAPFNTIIYVYRAIKWCCDNSKRKKDKAETKTKKTRRTTMFSNMKKGRNFQTTPVSFGWHIELTFADYYWKKIGEDRYAEKARQDIEEDDIAVYIEKQESSVLKSYV